jgi:hypothetical protein
LAAALVGFLLVLSFILATEYFDDSLKNAEKASKILKLKIVGVFPKIFLKTGTLNFPFITNRLLEMIIQQTDMLTQKKQDNLSPKTLVFLSALSNEGKTVTAGNLALKLKKQGKKVLFLNFTRESLRMTETSQIGYPTDPRMNSTSGFMKQQSRFPFISRMLGYPDNRVDISSPFLQKPENYLSSNEYVHYEVNADYNSVNTIQELLDKNNISPGFIPDYVLVEIPPVLYYSFPTQLIASANLIILVCRANRVWSTADQGALDLVTKSALSPPVVILNGVELQVVESVLGDLPKKRSWMRRVAKNLLRLQFSSKYQF